MSSTRFDPPVPTLEEVTGIGETTVPDRDGIIDVGENDISSSRNKRTLRSYISNLTQGRVPTENVVEYNGQLPPNHANPFPLTAEGSQPQFIDQDGLRDAVDLGNEPSSTFGDTSSIIGTGPLGEASNAPDGTGHELLAGVVGDREGAGNTITRNSGARSYARTLGEALAGRNLNSGQTVVDGEEVAGDRSFTREINVNLGTRNVTWSNTSSRVRLGDAPLGSSYDVASSEKVVVGDLAEIGKRLMIEAMGADPDEDPEKWLVGSLSSDKVRAQDVRAANAAAGTSLSDLNRTMISAGEDELIVNDGIGDTGGKYAGESWPTAFSPDSQYTGPTTGQAAFSSFVISEQFIGAVVATAVVGSLIPPIAPASVPAEVNSGLQSSRRLKPGEFRYEPSNAALSLVTQGLDALSDVTGLTLQNPIYVPTNPLVGYGDCVIAGLAYFLGVTIGIDPEIILRGNGAIGKLASLNGNSAILLAAITARLAVIYADPTSRQYYMNIIREINRDTVALGGQIGGDFGQVAAGAALDVLGIGSAPSIFDSKLFKFANTLAKIGDLAYTQAAAIDYRGTNIETEPGEIYDSFDYATDTTRASNARGFAARRVYGDKLRGRRGSTLSLTDLPSMHLVPNGDNQSYLSLLGSDGIGGRITSIKPAGGTNGRKRFTPEQVKAVESVLDAEYMPFYFQDLRTNEIVSFHAFLEDISDSYSAEYNSMSGYGRIEDIKTYKGTKRSVSCTFQVVSMNPQDFDYMWWQINKLTSMVYPQWSKGRELTGEDGFKFTQPFSQIPTATPVIRVRVGDLIRSNYSRFNLKRLFGFQDNEKAQAQVQRTTSQSTIYYVSAGRFEVVDPATLSVLISESDPLYMERVDERIFLGDEAVLKTYKKSVFGYIFVVNPATGNTISVPPQKILKETKVITSTDADAFYDSTNNSIIRSFESTAGMGLAAVVTQLQFTWMDTSTVWGAGEDGPGNRAPRSCKVQMTFEPIHDIAPGLDHEGFNRAPLYPVGNLINSIVEGGEQEPYGPGSQQVGSSRQGVNDDRASYEQAFKPGILSKLF